VVFPQRGDGKQNTDRNAEIGTEIFPFFDANFGAYFGRSFSSMFDAMDGNFTTQPVAATWGADAEFVDLTQLKQRFGIGRSLAYVLIDNGDIQSKVLRRKGNIKGKRLIYVPSVREFIAGQSDEIDPRLAAKCREANAVMREKKKAAAEAEAEAR